MIGVGVGPYFIVLDAASIEPHSFSLQSLHIIIFEFFAELNILDALKINMTILIKNVTGNYQSSSSSLFIFT